MPPIFIKKIVEKENGVVNIETSKNYFEISIMLYYIIRNTFLLLCKENETKIAINELDIIALIDRDFEILYKQYSKRSTKNFENYYNR